MDTLVGMVTRLMILSQQVCGFVFMLAVWLPVVQAQPAPAVPAAPVNMIRLDTRNLVPDVAIDCQGVVHMVYGNDHNAYYQRSADNGQTFTRPVLVNSEGTVETEMGERGPKLALGADGVIHVVWADKWKPGVKTAVRYARSTDGGKTFQPRQTLSSMNGCDGITLTADDKGHVLSFWHVMEGPKPDVKSATWLYVADSTDNGQTFAHDAAVKIRNLSPLACSMCMMRPQVGPDGQVYLAFRSAENNIRDFYVLKSAIAANDFTAVRVNHDNWKLTSCPMCGPALTLTPDGALLCAFMSDYKVYWALSTPNRAQFQLHVATPAHEANEIYPTAVANRADAVLMVWQVGPMSTKDTATVKWAVYTHAGQFTGQQGDVGQSYSGTKPTAFVGSDDAFYIITTAK